MWLPKSKYTVKYAVSGEMKRKDGTGYVGPYMEAYNGKCYVGKEFGENNEELESNIVEKTDVERKTINSKFEPTEEDYGRGYVTRYFRQNKTTQKIEELTEELYGQLESENTSSRCPYNYAECKWILRGPFEDINYNPNHNQLPYIYRGVRSRNLDTIEEMNEKLPGIRDIILTDPLEKARESSEPIKKFS